MTFQICMFYTLNLNNNYLQFAFMYVLAIFRARFENVGKRDTRLLFFHIKFKEVVSCGHEITFELYLNINEIFTPQNAY